VAVLSLALLVTDLQEFCWNFTRTAQEVQEMA
jgi:hypothetical protein